MKTPKLLLTALILALLLPVLYGQKLAKDQMVLTWNFSPKEGVESSTFETFMQEEYLPAVKKNFNGAEFYFIKSDRGASEGNYGILVVFESVEARDEWWPETGVSSEKAKKAMENMKEIRDKFMTLGNIDSWNDWLILK